MLCMCVCMLCKVSIWIIPQNLPTKYVNKTAAVGWENYCFYIEFVKVNNNEVDMKLAVEFFVVLYSLEPFPFIVNNNETP